MNDLVRPSSLLGRTAPTAAPSAIAATIPHPPPEVADLAVGTVLRGTILGEDRNGHVLVRTELGTLAVTARSHPPPNSEVTLQLRSSGTQLQVLLMPGRLDGGPGPARAPLPAAAPLATGADLPRQAAGRPPAPRPQGPATGHGAPPDQLNLGQAVRAVVQAPAPAAAPSPSGAESELSTVLSRLSPGSELTVRILSVQAPSPRPASAGGRAALDPPGAQGAGPVAGATADVGGPTSRAKPGAARPAVPGSAPDAAAASLTTQGPGAGPGALPGAAGLPGPPATLAASAQAQAAFTAPRGAAPHPPAPPTPGVVTSRSAGISVTTGTGAMTASGPRSEPPGPTRGNGPASSAPASASTPASGGPVVRAGTVPLADRALPTTPARAPGALRIPGEVTAITHAGRPVLQTPLGTMTLEVEAPLPSGSRVALELPAGALPRADWGGSPIASTSFGPAARDWPALEEALQILQSLGEPPAAASQAIPQPGPKLASGLLFFLSALSGGDLGRWIGDRPVEALKAAGHHRLLTRLGQEFGQLSRWSEATGGDWRLFLVPLLDGGQVQPLRLFLRDKQGRRGRPDAGEQDATRFVLEVELSRVGEMQLDGLVKAKRFDLILRTRQPLPAFMRQDITEIFQDASEAAGTTGAVGFQASTDWQFLPIDGPTAAAPPSLVV